MAYPDLCSLADVRAFLQKPSSDTAQDAIIGQLISRASLAIMRYTEREFISSTPGSSGSPVTRTFEFELQRQGWVDLSPYDAQSGTITSVILDPDISTPRTLTSAEWRAAPVPAADGVTTALRVIPLAFGGYHRFKDRQIQVSAQWGFPTVPVDVVHAAVTTTSVWLCREVSAFSTTFRLDEDRVERPESLPSHVRAALSPYRRMGAG